MGATGAPSARTSWRPPRSTSMTSAGWHTTPPGELGAAARLAHGPPGAGAGRAARGGPRGGQVGGRIRRAVAGEPGPDVVRAGQDQRPGLVRQRLVSHLEELIAGS